MRKIIGLFRLFRFELPFSAGVCVFLGQLLALGTLPSAAVSLLGFTSIFFISASALILNDYFDLEIDRINAPDRPLPSGLVTKNEVLILSIGSTFTGFAAAFLLSGLAFAIAAAVWIVGFLYNWKYKREGLIGNLMVSFSVGMTFVFGGITVGNPSSPMVLYFSLLVFLIDLGEEIAADAMDLAGDTMSGSRSLAVLVGRDRALHISKYVFGIVVMVSIIPFLLGWIAPIYFIPIVILDVIIIFSVRKLTDPATTDLRRYIRIIYLGGLVSLLIFIGVRLWIDD